MQNIYTKETKNEQIPPKILRYMPRITKRDRKKIEWKRPKRVNSMLFRKECQRYDNGQGT